MLGLFIDTFMIELYMTANDIVLNPSNCAVYIRDKNTQDICPHSRSVLLFSHVLKAGMSYTSDVSGFNVTVLNISPDCTSVVLNVVKF